MSDAATARNEVGVLLCGELASLHVQPPTDDPEQIVAHALFSDAAAAVTVVPGGRGLRWSTSSHADGDTAGPMT